MVHGQIKGICDGPLPEPRLSTKDKIKRIFWENLYGVYNPWLSNIYFAGETAGSMNQGYISTTEIVFTESGVYILTTGSMLLIRKCMSACMAISGWG